MSPKKSISQTFHQSNRRDVERRLSQNVRLARILRILQLLQGRGRYNVKEIAETLECAERTVYRDLDALELAGINREYDPNTKSIRLLSGWQFPVLNLGDEELLGQATANIITRSAGLNIAGGSQATTAKLAAVSTEERAELVADAQQLMSVLNLQLADHSRHHEMIKTVQWALLQQRQLQGEYRSPYQSKPIQLQLHPYRLCLSHQAWYLIGRTKDDEQPKTYRVARFGSLTKLHQRAEVPADFDLKSYFGNAWAVYRGSTSFHVELEFTPDAAPLVTETMWHSTQRAEPQPDGKLRLHFQVDGLDEIVWWVLSWSGRAKVIQPIELRQRVIEQLKAGLMLQENQP